MKGVKHLFYSLVDFIYPPLCLHCQCMLQERLHFLCAACSEHLVFVDPSDKCPYCCLPIEGRGGCLSCAHQTTLYKRCAITCSSQGSASSLLRQFQRGSYHLKHAIGSLMAMQVLQLNWPLPDLIVPMPAPQMQKLRCGFNGNLHLAQQIGEILERPVKLMGRVNQRRWCDQSILLVVDQFYQEQARRTAQLLVESFALEIRVISFLHA